MGNYFKDLADRLSSWNVIVGLIFLFLGILIAVLASKFAGMLTKKIEPPESRREKEAAIRMVFQISGLLFTVAGFIFAMVV